MEATKLIESASEIGKVSEDSIKEYMDKTDLLAAKMNEIMLERKDILELIGGEKNIKMMKDNNHNHLRFVASILQTPDSETLVDRSLWVFRAHMSRGFIANYFPAQINTWIQIMKENISKRAYNEIISIYNWFSVNIPQFSIDADEKLEKFKCLAND
jgi:hypothetical protein